MTVGVGLLLATLIGVFITPDGIVVGSDTALSDPSGQVGSQQKYCVTGARSVATLQGAYLLQDSVTKTTLELSDRFRDLCTQIGGSLSPSTLREQADYIANTLRADVVSFLERVPAPDVVRMYSSNRIVARISVTGFGARGPESVVVALGIATDAAAKTWQVQVSPLSRLSFAECGVRFHGQEGVVSALRTDNGVRIARTELDKADVAKLTALIRGNCYGASIQSAPSMFVEAARLTVTLGPGFGIPKGAVSLPVDVVVIPRDGPVEVRRIDSW
jgi:hypothetical protein